MNTTANTPDRLVNPATGALLLHPRDTANAFLAALGAAGWGYSVTWKWVGRSRWGVLVCTCNSVVVYQCEWDRNNSRWNPATDADVFSTQRGRPKHLAVTAALAAALAAA